MGRVRPICIRPDPHSHRRQQFTEEQCCLSLDIDVLVEAGIADLVESDFGSNQ